MERDKRAGKELAIEDRLGIECGKSRLVVMSCRCK